MRRSILVGLAALMFSACGSSTTPDTSTGTTTSSGATTTVTDLVVGGGSLLTGLAQRCQLTATATLNDGTTPTVTAAVAWSSSDTTIAVITSSGVLTTIKPGAVHITAIYAGFAGGTHVSIQPVTTTVQGTVAVSDGQSGSFTLAIKGSTAVTDTSTTAQVTGSIKIGANAPYAVTGIFQATSGAITLSTSDAPLRFGTITLTDGVLSGTYTQGSATGTLSSTSITTSTP